MTKSNQNRTPKFPKGFKKACDRPDATGGWVCDAPIEKLLDMCPLWNPEGRTCEEQLRSLVRSISRHGLNQYPVVNDDHVIDGNRRVAACHLLKHKEIRVIYRPGADAETYADVNQESKKHSPNQKQHTWRCNPMAVTETFDRHMQAAELAIGRTLVEWVIDKDHSVLSALRFARAALNYCKPECDPEIFVRQAVELQVKYRDGYAMRTWIEQGKSPVELANRIRDGRPLKV